MSQELILNLDYGSNLVKAAWRMFDPARYGRKYSKVPPYFVAGKNSPGRRTIPRITATESCVLANGRSLKESFLMGDIQPHDLVAYENEVENLLKTVVGDPFHKVVKKYQITPSSLLLNIHTPLRLHGYGRILETGLFESIGRENGRELVAPSYRTANELGSAGDRPETFWATWLTTRLRRILGDISDLPTRVAFIPESLTCVNYLRNLDTERSYRQWLVLDVGHFTTDLCLMIYDPTADSFRVRRANSYFDLGSAFISRHGIGSGIPRWLEAMRKHLASNNVAREEWPLVEDLEVIFMGGGTASLMDAQQELHKLIDEWFYGSVARVLNLKFGDRLPRKRLTFDFYKNFNGDVGLLSTKAGIPRESDLTLFLPSLWANGHAEEFSPIMIPIPRSHTTGNYIETIPAGGNAPYGQGY